MRFNFRPSTYIRPESLQHAVSTLETDSQGRIIAGGTDLLVEKNPNITSLVDISQLGLNRIESNETMVTIGSCTTLRTIETSSILQAPSMISVAEAASSVGGVAIRNVATVGGNLCNAVPSADMPPPLIALDSRAKIIGPSGMREVPLEFFFTGVRKTVVGRGEILVSVQIPAPEPSTGSSFLKLGRAAHDIAVVNAAGRVTLKDDVCKSARIVLGAVAPVPVRAYSAEKILEGSKLNPRLLDDAAATAASETSPITDVRASAQYRMRMCRVLAKRALERALLRASKRF